MHQVISIDLIGCRNFCVLDISSGENNVLIVFRKNEERLLFTHLEGGE
jgi:hypothetical protein